MLHVQFHSDSANDDYRKPNKLMNGFITEADLNDETHPLDSGYKKMAWCGEQLLKGLREIAS